MPNINKNPIPSFKQFQQAQEVGLKVRAQKLSKLTYGVKKILIAQLDKDLNTYIQKASEGVINLRIDFQYQFRYDGKAWLFQHYMDNQWKIIDNNLKLEDPGLVAQTSEAAAATDELTDLLQKEISDWSIGNQVHPTKAVYSGLPQYQIRITPPKP